MSRDEIEALVARAMATRCHGTCDDTEHRMLDALCAEVERLRMERDALLSRLRSELATRDERDRGAHATWDLDEDEILDRVRRGVEIEDVATEYIESVEGPLGNREHGYSRLRARVLGDRT